MSPQTNCAAAARSRPASGRSSRSSIERPLPARARATCEHRQREVERDDARTGIARRELADRLAGAAARVEDRLRREPHDIEALRHPRADLALQHRRRVVGRRRARERPPHRSRIDVERVGRRERRVRPSSERRQRVDECARMRQERRVRGARDRREDSASAAPPRATRRRVERAPACRDRRRSPAPATAMRAAPARRSLPREHRQRCGEHAPAPGSPRANSCARSAESVARPSSLPCTCSVRKRCSVSVQATRELVAEARERRRRHRVRPAVASDERRRRAHEDQPRDRAPDARCAQRIATCPPSDQPSTVSGSSPGTVASTRHRPRRRSTPGRTASIAGDCSRDPAGRRRGRDARAASAGRIGAKSPPCIAQPCSSTSGGPIAHRLDVQRRSSGRALTSRPSRRTAASASASSSMSTCGARPTATRASRAVPCGHRRRTDRRHAEAALPAAPRRQRDRGAAGRRHERLDRRLRRQQLPGQRRGAARGSARSAPRDAARRGASSRDQREATPAAPRRAAAAPPSCRCTTARVCSSVSITAGCAATNAPATPAALPSVPM